MDQIKKTRRAIFVYSTTVRALNFFVGCAATLLIVYSGYTGYVALGAAIAMGVAYGILGTMLMAQDAGQTND